MITNDFKAQEWINKNLADKNIRRIRLSPLTAEEVSWKKDVIAVGGNLTGDLRIEDYLECEEIGLKNHKLTSLVIVNCPKLEHLNVRNNQLTNLDLEKVRVSKDNKRLENDLFEIILGENNLISLNLVTCQKVRELIISDNSALSKIEKLNLFSLKNINLTNTLVSLSQDADKLRKENESLYEIIRQIDEAGQGRRLVLTEEIRSSLQTNEAIKRLLERTELSWREYFENEDDPEIAKKKPLLGLSFQHPDRMYQAKKILIWIIEAEVDGNYSELLKKWNAGDTYNKKYDYDGSLYTLMSYIRVRDFIGKNEKEEEGS
jgi:hypothetical protein